MMRPLLARPGDALRLLCLGAHSDDIEIGAGATILGLIERGVRLHVTWAVLSAVGSRATEARASAAEFLAGASAAEVVLGEFRDGYFPDQFAAIKEWFEALKQQEKPDVVFCHWGQDAHQDHRVVSQLVWNTFRDHLILEYEIPKWDGDLGRPAVYQPARLATMARKVELLERHFATQRSKDWFNADTFMALARLRGIECRAPDGVAEAFHVRKLVLG